MLTSDLDFSILWPKHNNLQPHVLKILTFILLISHQTLTNTLTGENGKSALVYD